jgi:hypothetical protein
MEYDLSSEITAGAQPAVLLINGSGLWVPLLIGLILLTGYMIGREARQ